MRSLVLLFFLSLQVSLFAQKAGSLQPETDTIIHDYSMNLAILVVDFTTYQFESANISYYEICTNHCDEDSLPFIFYFDSWWDFARVWFHYTYDSSLLFGAWVIWMGTGHIFYPANFISSSSFPYTTTAIPLPSDAEYYNTGIAGNFCTWEEYKARGQMAWNSIDSLEITNLFAEKPFRVGLYGYNRTEGEFDPYAADWIIFLYRGNTDVASVEENKETNAIKITPNPVTISAKISFSAEGSPGKIQLYDITGRIVKDIRLSPAQKEINLDISDLQPGLYVTLHYSGNRISGFEKLMIVR